MTPAALIADLAEEITRAGIMHGPQTNLPDGDRHAGVVANDEAVAREVCKQAFLLGEGTWAHVLIEEVAEALEEATTGPPARLRTELIQVAAVALRWANAIDTRSTP